MTYGKRDSTLEVCCWIFAVTEVLFVLCDAVFGWGIPVLYLSLPLALPLIGLLSGVVVYGVCYLVFHLCID